VIFKNLVFVIVACCFDSVRHISQMFSFVGLIYLHILNTSLRNVLLEPLVSIICKESI